MVPRKKSTVTKEGQEDKPKKKNSKKSQKKDPVAILEQDLQLARDNIQALNEQLASEKESVLRAYAELENFKRRKEQEKTDYIKFANEGLILELLTVIDSFDMAISQFSNAESEELQSLKEGVLLIHRQVLSFLDKYQVSKIEAMDQSFDPSFHQAVSQEAVEGVDANTVIRVMQPGYVLNNRVIRPAMVVVSK